MSQHLTCLSSTNDDSQAQGKISSVKGLLKAQRIRQTSTDPGAIGYTVTVVCKGNPKDKEIISGKITMKAGDVDVDQAKKLILADLQAKQIKAAQSDIVLLRQCKQILIEPDSCSVSAVSSHLRMLLVRAQLSLPPSHSHLPFPGPIPRHLSIASPHACLTWCSPVDVAGIHFPTSLLIGGDSIECSHPQLQKSDILVEFYQLPEKVKKYWGKQDSKDGLAKVKGKMGAWVERQGCRLVHMDRGSGHWFVVLAAGTNHKKEGLTD